MIGIRIRYCGPPLFEGVASGDRVEVQEGTTVAGLLTRFGVKAAFLHFVVPTVNGEPRDLNYVLQDGDELEPYLPVSGG